MDDLTIGLVVSFGTLFLVGVFIVLRLWLCPQLCRTWFREKDTERIIRMELSAVAFEDFMNGRLTTKLHSEITHLYALKGDLSGYKQVAGRLRHTYLIEFLKDPARHPMVIHRVIRDGVGASVGAAAPIQPRVVAGAGLDPIEI